MDELVGDDAGQVIEEGLGCRVDFSAAVGRPPSEVGLEVVREPHCLQDCGIVSAELRERHLHLGDGAGQGGSADSGPLVPLAGGIHLLLKTRLDGRLQRILLSTSTVHQAPYAAPRAKSVAWQ